MGFPKGASIPFGQGRGQNPAREVASLIDSSISLPAILEVAKALKYCNSGIEPRFLNGD